MKDEVFIGICLNYKTRRVRLMELSEDREKASRTTQERSEGDAWGIFSLDETTRSEVLWWLADEGITRIEGEEIFELIVQAITMTLIERMHEGSMN